MPTDSNDTKPPGVYFADLDANWIDNYVDIDEGFTKLVTLEDYDKLKAERQSDEQVLRKGLAEKDEWNFKHRMRIDKLNAELTAALAEIEQLRNELKFIQTLRGQVEQIDGLKSALTQAVQFLKEGKIQFAPHTTNSFVDDFIAKWDKK